MSQMGQAKMRVSWQLLQSVLKLPLDCSIIGATWDDPSTSVDFVVVSKDFPLPNGDSELPFAKARFEYREPIELIVFIGWDVEVRHGNEREK